MEIQYLKNEDISIWDDFIERSPQRSIFGKSWYLDALNIHYRILVAIKNDEIISGIILTKNEIKTYSNPLLVKYLGIYYKPFKGKSYNIITQQNKVASLLLNELVKFKTFDYTFHPSFVNWLPFFWKNFRQQTLYTYYINFMNKSIEEIFSNFHSKLKNEIKYAQMQQYQIVYELDFDLFYRIHEKTFLRQGGRSPFKKNELATFCRVLTKKKAIQLIGIKDSKNTLMAVSGIVYDQHISHLLFNGFDPNTISRGANEYLIFKTIEFAYDKSIYFDFEGSMLKSIESFYRKFGGELMPYSRIWQNNFFNSVKQKMIKLYKKLKYGK